MTFESNASSVSVKLEIRKLGDDYLVSIGGGDKVHIGSVVLAVPRPSLGDPAETSCTSSVLNRLGHKDEAVCRVVAETLCKHYGKVVVCVGGIHVDHIRENQFDEIFSSVDDLLRQVMKMSG